MDVSSGDFNYLRQLVYQHTAVVLGADKIYLAELHLEPIARSAGFNSISPLVIHLQHHPFAVLHQQVIEALVTNETSFFRDRYPFEALEQLVLPTLLRQRENQRSLHIWCAACSTGQEAYSIAMLIHNRFPQLLNWSLHLLASDFSSKALQYARTGCYTPLEMKRGLPEPFMNQYFQLQGNSWQVISKIRQMVEFQEINLVQPWPPLPSMDIIFLRNVLIYFDTSTKRNVLHRIRQQLNRDSYLFLGGGETTLNLDDSFNRIQSGNSICYQPRHPWVRKSFPG